MEIEETAVQIAQEIFNHIEDSPHDISHLFEDEEIHELAKDLAYQKMVEKAEEKREDDLFPNL